MIINFKDAQRQKFDELVLKIQKSPEHYLNFESVSDFYKAPWLNDFPQGTIWTCTGMDDGAEEFYALITYQNRILKISCLGQIKIQFDIIAE